MANARQAYDLGTVCARQGRFDEAATQFQRALKTDPRFAEAHNNLGNVRKAQGDLAGAITCYQRCLAIRPDFVLAHDNLGIALRDAGRLVEAAASHRRALALDPASPASHFNLGNVHLRRGEADAAAACFRRVLTLRPHDAPAHLNLGNALHLLGDLTAAAACYERAVHLAPGDAQAHHNLGRARLEQERLDEAAVSLRRALAVRPDYADAHVNLGNALQGQGDFAQALACYRRAIHARPDHVAAHVNAAFMLLMTGDFAAGWREYEWRWRSRDVTPHGLTAPLWQGEELDGKTILLHCEQGLGDSIQFIRYAPMVKARGGQVVLACPTPLARLFGSVAGIDRSCPEGRDVPACDCHAPLLSLPFLFGTRIDSIPRTVPYIAPPTAAAEQWAERLAAFRGRRIGLVWAGNPRIDQPNSHRVDRRRSMRLADFAPLADLPDVHWFSLQKGGPAEQARHPPAGMVLHDFMAEIADFADTAALVANLDLVIGVDTSVVHLAGAMGKPAWLLSRFDGCWRWLLEREDSPWYPSLRLFRQPAPGDWGAVVEEVRKVGALPQTPPGGSAPQTPRWGPPARG